MANYDIRSANFTHLPNPDMEIKSGTHGSVVFEFVDPYGGSAGHPYQTVRSPPMKPLGNMGPDFALSQEELFSLMTEATASDDISDRKEEFEKEIDVYALVPEPPCAQQCPYGLDGMYVESDNQVEEEPDFDVDSLYALLEERRRTIKTKVDITPLAVTTQSAKAVMSQPIDLQLLATTLRDAIVENIDEGVRENFAIRGVLCKKVHAGEIRKPKPTKTGQFPNNCSVLIRSPMGTGRHINMKIFRGGKITMTGCLVKEDGIAAIKILEQYLRKQRCIFEKKESLGFKISQFQTTMVNSGYQIGFEVDRERLYEFLTSETELNVSYAPATYAGVKIAFYYNSINKNQDGICRCPGSPCTGDKTTAGKGSGDKVGQCKRVTVAIFESGKVIDTGGRNIKHANTAYTYVNKVIRKNANKFVKINVTDVLSSRA